MAKVERPCLTGTVNGSGESAECRYGHSLLARFCKGRASFSCNPYRELHDVPGYGYAECKGHTTPRDVIVRTAGPICYEVGGSSTQTRIHAIGKLSGRTVHQSGGL